MASKRKLEDEIKLVLNLIPNIQSKNKKSKIVHLNLSSIKPNNFNETGLQNTNEKPKENQILEVTTPPSDEISAKAKTSIEKKSVDLCTTCNLKKFKYKCPGCESKSCSVECAKYHKKMTKCSGKKMPFDSVLKRSDITEKSCSSDYKFLQKGTHMITSVGTASHTHFVQKNFDLNQSINVQLALQLDNVKWKPMCFAFTRHKNNRTFFHKSKHFIKWHVEWNFNCGKIKKQFTKPCEFTDSLEDLIKPFLDVKSLLYDYNLDSYKKCFMKENSKLHFFLCNEEVSVGDSCFKKLEGMTSVNKNLNGSIIIEYPRIHVVLEADLQKYISNKKQDIDTSLK